MKVLQDMIVTGIRIDADFRFVATIKVKRNHATMMDDVIQGPTSGEFGTRLRPNTIIFPPFIVRRDAELQWQLTCLEDTVMPQGCVLEVSWIVATVPEANEIVRLLATDHKRYCQLLDEPTLAAIKTAMQSPCSPPKNASEGLL